MGGWTRTPFAPVLVTGPHASSKTYVARLLAAEMWTGAGGNGTGPVVRLRDY
jgi:hypothetical protein